jgi:hypothetical protein
MSYPAIVRVPARSAVDQRSVFCPTCTHSEFVHSEREHRRCLFSECPCDGFREPIDAATDEPLPAEPTD